MESPGGRARPARANAGTLALVCWLCACTAEARGPAGDVGSDSLRTDSTLTAHRGAAALQIDTVPAPPRLRPQALSNARTLWGLLRGRLARVHLDSGAVVSLAPVAWGVTSGTNVIAWRNEEGTWLWREGREPARIAGAEPIGEYDGPPAVLFSPDGRSALLSWQAEWSLHHELLDTQGTRRVLDLRLPGYMAHGALLWLDSARILFSATAVGPAGGAPEYRESGWRGDLAVLDLTAGSFRRVTEVPDGTFLRVAGTHRGAVLVAEYGADGPRHFWHYDPRSWERRALSLPPGRAFAHGPIAIVLVPAGGDSARALLASGDSIIALGTVAQPDEVPAFAPDGGTAVLRTGAGSQARLVRIRVP